MKRILVISADYTGYGHKSISNSIKEIIDEKEDAEIKVVDGFTLIGKWAQQMSRIYGPMTKYVPWVWAFFFKFGNLNNTPTFKHSPMEIASARKFFKLMDEYKPDLVVNVHPMFNKIIARHLDNRYPNVPMVTIQADIVSIHKLWCEPKAYCTICPTEEAYEASLTLGMPREKLKVIGFPTRKLFTDAARNAKPRVYDGSRPLRILMMSGGDGMGGMMDYVEHILHYTDAKVTVICGRNATLRARIKHKLSAEYKGRLRVLGFINNVQEEMQKADLLLTRCSPNSLMEGVVMNIPLIMIGTLPGQEEANPVLVENHKLGVKCFDYRELSNVIDRLMADDMAEYKMIKQSQLEYRNLDNAKNIAEYLISVIDRNNITKDE